MLQENNISSRVVFVVRHCFGKKIGAVRHRKFLEAAAQVINANPYNKFTKTNQTVQTTNQQQQRLLYTQGKPTFHHKRRGNASKSDGIFKKPLPPPSQTTYSKPLYSDAAKTRGNGRGMRGGTTSRTRYRGMSRGNRVSGYAHSYQEENTDAESNGTWSEAELRETWSEQEESEKDDIN